MKSIPWKRIKTETGLKVSTQNKILNRLSILLAQIKAGNNSNQLKNEISTIKSL